MTGRGLWRGIRAGGAFLLLLTLKAAGVEGKATKPRELSAAERAAVAYIQGGPAAWLPRLAKGFPLGRLQPPEARQEIAARMGPVDGSTWMLFTPGPTFDADTAIFGIEYASGVDETIILRLVNEGGWKISEIRTSVDKFEPRAAAWRGAAEPAAPGPELATSTACCGSAMRRSSRRARRARRGAGPTRRPCSGAPARSSTRRRGFFSHME
ncbi:MAG TPA: hypothetical protein VKM72_02380 [Thermoanaerobaculia bacterium]|nr:hypothetical protein [Thermoanaerobaculia bacterium]